MDRLWGLKFTSVFPIAGNQLNAFFDNEEAALKVFNEHATSLSTKPDDEMKILIFQDLIGRQCLRSNWFPHCLMSEVGPNDLAMMEVNKKIEVSQRAAGFTKSVGFEISKEGAK